eukprot:164354_1
MEISHIPRQIKLLILEYSDLTCECGVMKMIVCEKEKCNKFVCYQCAMNQSDPLMVHWHCQRHLYGKNSEPEENYESYDDQWYAENEYMNNYDFDDEFDG